MSSSNVLGKRKRSAATHPYLSGNYAPVQQTCTLTPCSFSGSIPPDLSGGQYVRNGSNPVSNEDLGREAHWFDGDGMLSGVFFSEDSGPQFVNQYILTDVYLSATSTPTLRKPILPSIATLVNPLSSFFRVIATILRTIFLVLLSRMPGSKQVIKKISVANTAIMYHDGRALATCESGPPLRVSLPTLDTVGWFNGVRAEGEPLDPSRDESERLGGNGLLRFMKEWTTAHPKVDPTTNDMILFHSSFSPPYVHYSIIPPSMNANETAPTQTRLLNKPVAGVSSAKMMHDFGVSKSRTVILDLPLSLDPRNLLHNKPPIIYDSSIESRFGIFPRREPAQVRWFETAPCCIFHTVNTWDVSNSSDELESVDMLVCRMTTASVVFNAGNIVAPRPKERKVNEVFESMARRLPDNYIYEKGPEVESNEHIPLLSQPQPLYGYQTDTSLPYEDEQCRLYYYSFSMNPHDTNKITHQFALSAIPFEFPSVRPGTEMSYTQFVYGCTTTQGTFNPSLGNDAKIDALVKFDIDQLLSRAKSNPPNPITGCVDNRSVNDIVATENWNDDSIQIFQTPPHHFAQEPRFAPSMSSTKGDDGFLLAYIFDEEQLTSEGNAPPLAVSELWIIDAKGMKDTLAKITLPQRVPYGLHGNWFSESEILHQRPIESLRRVLSDNEVKHETGHNIGRKFINRAISAIGG